MVASYAWAWWSVVGIVTGFSLIYLACLLYPTCDYQTDTVEDDTSWGDDF